MKMYELGTLILVACLLAVALGLKDAHDVTVEQHDAEVCAVTPEDPAPMPQTDKAWRPWRW